MKRPRFGVTIRRLLLRIFAVWAEPLIINYKEPRRAGTPKGDKIGLSRSKYFCALLQALHGPFSLAELSEASFAINLKGVEVTGASVDLIGQWRTEKGFRDEADKASRSFADSLITDMLQYNYRNPTELIIRMILMEALILLPGFNINNNLILDKINEIFQQGIELEAISDQTAKIYIFDKLDEYLITYGNILDIMQEYIDEREAKVIKEMVYNVIYDMRPNIQTILDKGKLTGTIDDDDAEYINEILNRFEGLLEGKNKGAFVVPAL